MDRSFCKRVIASILDSPDLENNSVVVKDWVVVEGMKQGAGSVRITARGPSSGRMSQAYKGVA